MSRDDDSRRPPAGGDSEHRELDRQQGGILLRLRDVGVDPADKRLDDGFAARVVVIEFGVEVAPECVQSRADIALQLTTPQHLGDGAGRLPPPHLELKEPIACRGVALCEEQIVFRLRVNVIDAPSVADDLDRLREPLNPQRCRGRLRVDPEPGW